MPTTVEVRSTLRETKVVPRLRCVSCLAPELETLSVGRYADPQLRARIEAEPWGESPIPYLRDERWEFVRCRRCSQMFHKLILSQAAQDRVQRVSATGRTLSNYEEQRGPSAGGARFDRAAGCVRHVLRLDKMTSGFRGDEALRVLDFGCGDASFMPAVRLFGAEAYGVDCEADRKPRASDLGPVVADLEELPRSLKGRFDAVALFGVLEQVEQPLRVLEDLREWLRPGGILILETRDCTGADGFDMFRDYPLISPLRCINAFVPRSLTAIARRAGYAPTAPLPAYVTTELLPVTRARIRRALHGVEQLVRPSTQQYFRRV